MELLKLEEDVVKRSTFFQDVQIWPINNKLNYEGWLSNFKTDEEKRIGYALLNSFIYYSDDMVNELLKKCLILSSCYIKTIIKNWNIIDIYENAFFSYMPGEKHHITDSGLHFVRILKKVFNISESKILSPLNLFDNIDKISKDTPIIFVDDFVGTGTQAKEAWNDFNINGINLSKLLQDKISIYSPLICNQNGYNRILKECVGLKLICNHILGDEYNMRNENCISWAGDLNLYNSAKSFLFTKGKELDIYSYCMKTIDIYGYSGQGLSIAFEHGTPDATSAIYTHKSDNWKPLIIY